MPPPFNDIIKTYEKENPEKHLRLGQWFFNNYLKNTTINFPHDLNTLYNSTDFGEILDILSGIYKDYQWT